MLPLVLRNQGLYFGCALLPCFCLPNGVSVLWAPGWAQPDFFPGLAQVLCEVALCMLVFDMLLGVSHYVLHTKRFYRCHKLHHQVQADVPISSWYMGVLDLVMELWIPIVVPTLAMGMSWLGL